MRNEGSCPLRELAGTAMKAILRVDATPGYEAAVEARLVEVDRGSVVVEDKIGNHDLADAIDTEDADSLRAIENAIRHETGVQGLEQEIAPDQDLPDRLRPG